MSKTDANLILKDAYTLIAEQWCGPPEADEDREQVRKDAECVADRVNGVNKEIAALLSRRSTHWDATQAIGKATE